MRTFSAVAHAKLNLTLDVVGKRPDGYHDLEMVMQEIALGDRITLEIGTGRPWTVRTDSGEIPCDDTNLAVKAARLFLEAAEIDCGGLTVTIEKRTPVCAGMGGGSADGAAVLRLLDRAYGSPLPEEQLYGIAERVGSDVPFALFGGTALAREKGQVLSRLPGMPRCQIVLCKPDFPISTPALFRAIDRAEITRRPDTEAMVRALEQGDLAAMGRSLYNVFQPLVAAEHPVLEEIRDVMTACGALGAAMTGSGPTVFGLFDDEAGAGRAYEALRGRFNGTFLTEPV